MKSLKNISTKQIVIGASIVIGGFITYRIIKSQLAKGRVNKLAKKEEKVEGEVDTPVSNYKNLPSAWQRYQVAEHSGNTFWDKAWREKNQSLINKVKNNPAV